MAGKREEKKAALKQSLIESTEAQMRETGLGGLRARDIATGAGCALGSLYTVFKDLDDLALHVNLRTVAALDDALAQACKDEKDPKRQLVGMAAAYHAFAVNNENLWFALFNHQLHGQEALPDWYQEKHMGLFRHVVKPLQTLDQEMTDQEAEAQARTLFSAAHGIVSVNLQARFIKVPNDVLSQRLSDFILTHIKGMEG